MKKKLVAAVAALGANALLFFIYRVLFLRSFTAGLRFGEAMRICWSGLRLDLVLLGNGTV